MKQNNFIIRVNCKGFTLIELLVASTLSMGLMYMLSFTLVNYLRHYRQINKNVDRIEQLAIVEQNLVEDLRYCQNIRETGSRLTIVDGLGTEIQYWASDGVLRRRRIVAQSLTTPGIVVSSFISKMNISKLTEVNLVIDGQNYAFKTATF